MAKNAISNNLESDNKGTKYEITFGVFNENERGEMHFPPKNSKKYGNLLKNLKEDSMVIATSNYEKKLDENGNVIARIGEDGKVLTEKHKYNGNREQNRKRKMAGQEK